MGNMGEIRYTEKTEYDNCVKYDYKIINDNGDTVEENVLTLSHWQVNDGKLENRLKQLAEKRLGEKRGQIKALNTENV